ncbi:MAG: FAD-binding protein [gamma proteobacterium endosymbiont of Lamellibrachia anaximandri]|nr:FAD-binding protein [gamma proteobacterium endosymbiont of Lamellibrachia anaximandri]
MQGQSDNNSLRRQRQRRTLADAFLKMLPADAVIFREEELVPYECDGLSAYRQVPLIVLLPYDTGQVQAILRYCHANKIPVVARGAGTGLSGGALPHEDGVLLSLARLNKILEVDQSNMRARVQPGVRNLAISDAARSQGLYYAPDPSSQIACSIGGNVAENAGGVHCLKYGLTVNNLLEVTLITIEGEQITLGASESSTS